MTPATLFAHVLTPETRRRLYDAPPSVLRLLRDGDSVPLITRAAAAAELARRAGAPDFDPDLDAAHEYAKKYGREPR